jgi:hypothetical protein
MSKLIYCAALAMVCGLAGCVPSLNPLYTEKDLIFEAALLGVWGELEDAVETWDFQRAGDKESKAYRLVYTDEDGKRGEFKAHLVRLENGMYLDLYPEPAALEESRRNDFYKSHFLLVHTFARVLRIEPELQMAFINPDRLKEVLEKEPGAIRHERLDESSIVLTAAAAELQRFVVKHARGLFRGDDEGEAPKGLKKLRGPPAKAPAE